MRKETIERCGHEARTSVGLVGIVVAYRFSIFRDRKELYSDVLQ
jgi:hypothetical protein